MITYKTYEINAPFKKVYWHKKNKKRICKQYICLDTETSHNHNPEAPACWIYQWAFTFNHSLYYGRKPSELISKLKKIISFYNIDENNKLMLFIHNLPYDFSYLCLFFQHAFGDPEHVLASEPHKPFCVQYSNGLELRCTYKLSNDSLERWGNKLNIKYKKLSGAIDYNMIRYQDSPLYRDDWRYMWTDCIALDQSLRSQMMIYNDNLLTLPLTSTGYPRREMFRAYNGAGKHDKKNKERQKFKDTRLEVDSYIGCYEEFSGGITHGNRYYKGKTLKGNIRHRDFRSHYPTQQHRLFPMDKLKPFTGRATLEELKKYSAGNFLLCHVILEDIRIADRSITLPYLQTSHVMRKHTQGSRLLDDNGRVVQFKGQTELWLEYNELELIFTQYTIRRYIILESYGSVLGPLPTWFTDTIDTHFKAKTDLKHELEELERSGASREEIFSKSMDLMKSKNLLNGIYGVSATNPVRSDIELHGDIWEPKKPTMEEIGEKLDFYYKSYKHCMRYQWGIQVTILARLQLMEVYNIIGPDNFIYADTDSMFYFSTPEIEQKLNEYNEKCRKWAMDHGAYITTASGQVINYNAFTDEGEDITEFRFLHSKCYAYVTSDGKLHCTIAGVKEYDRDTKTWRVDELGSIDELKSGKVFTKCGGTTSTYLNQFDMMNYWPEGYYNQESYGGCIISRTTKTLSSEEWSESEKAFRIKYEDEEP